MNRAWVGLILVVVTALVYYSSFPGAFHYDDFPLLLENSAVNGSDFDYSYFLYQYGGRPLTLLTFHLNHQLLGNSAFGFHLINVGLHALVVVLLFTLSSSITGRLGVGFLTALLFAVHPAQVQAVNYIWSRSLLLMSVFVLLAMITRRPWLSLVFFQLSIWSRAEALAALAPLIWKDPKRWKVFLLLAGSNLVLFFFGFLIEDPSAVAWNHPNLLTFWLTSAQAFWMYAHLALWPFGFSIYHGPLNVSWEAIAAFSLTLVAGTLLWTNRKRNPWMIKGLLWFALFLAPGLLIPNSTQFSESRIYLAVAGLTFAAAGSLLKLYPRGILEASGVHGAKQKTRCLGRPLFESLRSPAASLLLPLVLLLGTFILKTHERNRIWLSDIVLWQEAVHKYPQDHVPHYNLAVSYARQGRNEDAENEFRTALSLNRSDDMVWAGLGYCEEARDQWLEALANYESALFINPANRYAIESSERVRAIIGTERLAH